MFKVALLVLMAGLSGNAAAEWTRVFSDAEFTAYIDFATVRKAGDKTNMRVLNDLTTARMSQGRNYLSAIFQIEIDCKEETLRPLAMTFYSGKMATATVIHSNSTPGKEGPIAPGTVAKILWKTACT